MMRRTTLQPRADRNGPVFISYRRSDGAAHVALIEAFMWAGGIAPWRDVIDLAAGETDLRIREAFRDGISSAILVVTPEIGLSEFIPRVELPALLRLDSQSANSSRNAVSSPAQGGHGEVLDQFRLYIVNTIAKPDGAETILDVKAPDRLLKTGPRFTPLRWALSPARSPLATRQQYPLLTGQASTPVLQHLLRDLIRQRLKAREGRLGDDEIDIDLQSRPVGDAYTRPTRDDAPDTYVDLVVRLDQDPASSIPSELSYRCLQAALPIMLDEIHNRQITKIAFSGGGHQSFLWAIGAAFPEARHAPGTIKFTDARMTSRGHDIYQEHTSLDEGLPGDQGTHHVRFVDLEGVEHDEAKAFIASVQVAADRWRVEHPGEKPRILAFMAGADPELGLVESLAARIPNCIGSVTLAVKPDDPDKSGRFFPTNEGHRLAGELAGTLRQIHRVVRTDLHVAASLPAGLMLLTGRRCNTVPVIWYERQTLPSGTSAYCPVIRCESGPKRTITHVYVRERRLPATLVNCLPHPVTLLDEADQPLRTWQVDTSAANDHGEDATPKCTNLVLGDDIHVPVQNLAETTAREQPPRKDGVGYLVPLLAAQVARRPDFYVPLDEVRDDAYQLLGFRSLGTFDAQHGAVDAALSLFKD